MKQYSRVVFRPSTECTNVLVDCWSLPLSKREKKMELHETDNKFHLATLCAFLGRMLFRIYNNWSRLLHRSGKNGTVFLYLNLTLSLPMGSPLMSKIVWH